MTPAPTKPRQPTEITLPLPPSVNHYWRMARGKMIISADGKQYRKAVCAECIIQRAKRREGRLSMAIKFYPPDARRRDIDNLLKAVLDSCAHAGVYEDDSQIDVLTISRGPKVKGGAIVVTITELSASGQEVG